jgi:hypothetical protein
MYNMPTCCIYILTINDGTPHGNPMGPNGEIATPFSNGEPTVPYRGCITCLAQAAAIHRRVAGESAGKPQALPSQ